MGLAKLLESWPALRQLREGDPLGLGKAVAVAALAERSRRGSTTPTTSSTRSARTARSAAASSSTSRTARSSHIEGDPASPISRGRLCPKGQASKSYAHSPLREYKVKYRRPYGTRVGGAALDEAMDMIADRVVETRADDLGGRRPRTASPRNRTMAIGNLGGATLDNEENYLIKKLMTALGIVQVENQARI